MTKYKRGDIVLVDFSFSEGRASKKSIRFLTVYNSCTLRNGGGGKNLVRKLEVR